MHRLEFTKMSGAGNDFVMLDNRANVLRLDAGTIARLCDRHRGVGADGVLLVEPPALPQADFRMRYYNADGGEAEMCGNGARCFARFAARLVTEGGDQHGRDTLRFETQAGLIQAQLEGERVRLNMSQPTAGMALGALDVDGSSLPEAFFINTGVPHVVVPVADVDRVDVYPLGRAIRYHPRFAPKGANANFIEVLGPAEIRLRTYERGVEAETLACGTGATASALIHAELLGLLGSANVGVRVRSGDLLHIGFERVGPFEYRDVTLGGPAEFVFRGEIAI
jgi:diaminopimelate epimerase